ncbi:MAG: hypothetical protein CMJ87_08600 [Planctomycetes bacterium]|nr:hypothetical protein [Planctomycetota bacterium]
MARSPAVPGNPRPHQLVQSTTCCGVLPAEPFAPAAPGAPAAPAAPWAPAGPAGPRASSGEPTTRTVGSPQAASTAAVAPASVSMDVRRVSCRVLLDTITFLLLDWHTPNSVFVRLAPGPTPREPTGAVFTICSFAASPPLPTHHLT